MKKFLPAYLAPALLPSLARAPRIAVPAGVVKLTRTRSADSAEEGMIDQLALLHF